MSGAKGPRAPGFDEIHDVSLNKSATAAHVCLLLTGTTHHSAAAIMCGQAATTSDERLDRDLSITHHFAET